ncbi:MAG: hypothetical protein A3K60_02415 [Euryarchaeota archaeon RBG_19FT_COMBO_56_21]|nr:MAG: hypothetical protein A3K60_02415 [Euryarchaeota archaeon RBG_19FT_COMBO_56_21]
MRKKGIPRLRLKARIASKVMEKDLREKAKLLMDDPDLILPDCAEDCGSCPFKKTRARIEKIQRYKDDPVKLAKFARGGDKLARAYAATIRLAHEEKTPYLATATYPAGTVAYALRGKTPKEKLIGVQNFDSPKWRVLSVADLVHKKNLHFYSYGDNFICTGRSPKPPAEYVEIASESVGATKREGDTFVCPHSPTNMNHIVFEWVNAKMKTVLCDQCSGKIKNNLAELAQGMAVPRILDEFNVDIIRPLRNKSGERACNGLLDDQIDDDLLEKYANGELGNKDLIERHMQNVLESIKTRDKRVYVRGEICYGQDVDSFVSDLASDETDRKALNGLLAKVKHPVVIEQSDSPNKLLTIFWKEHGLDSLRAVVSKKLADRYFEDPETEKSPLRAIRSALKEEQHDAISSRIPTYSCLSHYGSFADSVTKGYKTKGPAGAIAALDGDKSSDHRIRSMAHAFYLALGVTTKSWKYTDEEKQYGEHLKQYAQRLLESEETEQHHDAFVEFLRQAGCTDEVKRA